MISFKIFVPLISTLFYLSLFSLCVTAHSPVLNGRNTWKKRQNPISPPTLPNLPPKPNHSSTPLRKYLPPGIEPSAGCKKCESSLSFEFDMAKKFEVGTNIPGLPFRTKKSWAGNIPIPDTETVKNGSLHFWLWGKDSPTPDDDLIIWMNGGPGCSSMFGLCETGPFTFGPEGPRPNPYSWTIAANIVYVSQPVGVSFTTGISNNTNEAQISEQLTAWFWQFFGTFPELFRKRVWIVGESYMGRYSAYQFDAFFKKPVGDTPSLLQGGMLISPAFSSLTTQLDTPIYQFVKQHKKLFKFNDQDLVKVKNESDTCHLTNFVRDHLTYPPKGRLPNPSEECETFDTYLDIAHEKNPNFNIYNIKERKKKSDKEPTALEKFFNRTDVQDYIHAPRQNFILCKPVFGKENEDQSDPPDRTPSFEHSNFAKMIEKSKDFLMVNGMLDGLVLSTGTELALQNLTWGGLQGFNLPPLIPLCDMEGDKRAFATDKERNLRLVIVPNAGHMVSLILIDFSESCSNIKLPLSFLLPCRCQPMNHL